ncbi:hypothetical protein TEQG_01825 [Trichophyton equinum CBS 127.97]|uniref:F-box domain-containing protein n=1 Tax=Trichophyton equinum (strain ATCC MYA-4606 / CBS 127.97) TaxID=559882 RepID=F2PLL9_TRIEC|nr:hypothetical protein TEQG_01825 [Trichophyton equinum CBS 127.97]
MDRLPDELLMHIIYQAIDMRGERNRTNFASVSRRLQAIIAEAKNRRFFDGRQYVGFYDSSEDEESRPESTKFTRAIYTLFEALGRGDANAQPPPALKLGRDSIASSGIYPITIERFLRIVPLDDHRKTLPILRCVESF